MNRDQKKTDRENLKSIQLHNFLNDKMPGLLPLCKNPLIAHLTAAWEKKEESTTINPEEFEHIKKQFANIGLYDLQTYNPMKTPCLPSTSKQTDNLQELDFSENRNVINVIISNIPDKLNNQTSSVTVTPSL
ncbi:DgyrCDS14912 [Dimorphilus gyrociliatus]|uniref:DgyrCDS14912 n=1 Tax=Dimorphilus gyrociliatus TaxID=2664684 RepID=A0A7I8WFL3_9ANNE|nr:DgyrCDS14912 [Dimorphilus gyrociliatus]